MECDGEEMPIQTARLKDPAVRTSIHLLEELTTGYRGPAFAVRLWDGTEWNHSHRPRYTLILKHPGTLRNMFTSPSELTLGEAFIYGDFDVEGDLEAAFEFADFLLARDYSVIDRLKLGSLLARLPSNSARQSGNIPGDLGGAVHSKERDQKAVTYHYDVSNEFYSLWLDRSMVYSCAYFSSIRDGIDTAQTQKLDYICRKLRLRAGDRLLDVGCGWGGLLVHAAKNYGVCAVGITLSVPQADLARQRVRDAGLEDRCRIEVCDYRDLEAGQEYDKVVSVGMFEHVGEALLPEYFRRASSLLRPGGVFLNHGIAASAVFQRKGPSFVDKYVFPDGELVPVNVTLCAAEAAGFEVRDVESLREHYALTLRQWVRRLESKAEEARNFVGDLTYRVWRLYMSGSAHAFTTGRLNLYQVLLSKPERGQSHLPLTRADWYS
jgi:cyclopropane-fatty-acyl-phospholipid synthase